MYLIFQEREKLYNGILKEKCIYCKIVIGLLDMYYKMIILQF